MRLTIPAAFALILASVTLVACGGSSNSDSSSSANGTDRAFSTEMIAHHEMAIDMAEVAQDKATRPQIQQLADDIVAAQKSEIDQMTAADKRMAANGVKPADLGLSDSMMGMDMSASEMAGSKDFDRMFIDMMVTHHEGAVRMARVELAKGEDPQMRELAEAIIAAQTKEIRQMNRWRAAWYGSQVPSGGSTEMNEQMDEHSGMDHSGM